VAVNLTVRARCGLAVVLQTRIYFRAGPYRLHYNRPRVRALLLQSITPCAEIEWFTETSVAVCNTIDSIYLRRYILSMVIQRSLDGSTLGFH